MKPKLENALQREKDERLRQESREKWLARYRGFVKLVDDELEKTPFNTVGPDVGSLAVLDEFKEILELPIEDELTPGDFEQVFSSLPEFRSRWVRESEQALVELLQASGTTDATADKLHLCTSTFTCKECGKLCLYPRPLVHRCTSERDEWDCMYLMGMGASPDLSLHNFSWTTGAKCWEASAFVFDKVRSEFV